MEFDEQIYVNIEELQGGTCKRQRSETETGGLPLGSVNHTSAETKHERRETVAAALTETQPHFRVSTVCLGLLCFLLLTAVITVCVLYNRDFNQLSRDLTNQTAEKHQLWAQNQNLTDERDHLKLSLNHLKLLFKNLTRTVGTCPNEWKKFGCSCYYFSTTTNTWSRSQQICQLYGANLVVIKSQREMMFLNKFGLRLKFWIGLSQPSSTSTWKWTDESSLITSYWQDGHPPWTYTRRSEVYQRCAAFNSFSSYSMWAIKSWTAVSCSSNLQSVCEKEIETPW